MDELGLAVVAGNPAAAEAHAPSPSLSLPGIPAQSCDGGLGAPGAPGGLGAPGAPGTPGAAGAAGAAGDSADGSIPSRLVLQNGHFFGKIPWVTLTFLPQFGHATPVFASAGLKHMLHLILSLRLARMALPQSIPQLFMRYVCRQLPLLVRYLQRKNFEVPPRQILGSALRGFIDRSAKKAILFCKEEQSAVWI